MDRRRRRRRDGPPPRRSRWLRARPRARRARQPRRPRPGPDRGRGPERRVRAWPHAGRLVALSQSARVDDRHGRAGPAGADHRHLRRRLCLDPRRCDARGPGLYRRERPRRGHARVGRGGGRRRERPDAARRRARRRGAQALRARTRRDGALPQLGSGARRRGTQPEPAPVKLPALVTTEWLAANVGRRGLRVLDGSWHMPELKREAFEEFVEVHVPGAAFFDIDEIADPSTPLPHMLPSAWIFAERVGRLVPANLTHRREQVLDARSHGRFVGTEPEPRPGLRPGHIPGSLNLPYELLHAKDGTLLGLDALRRAFETAGVDLDRPVVTTCGSGITASVLAFGLYLLGRERVAVYDGSWTEWGRRPDTP